MKAKYTLPADLLSFPNQISFARLLLVLIVVWMPSAVSVHVKIVLLAIAFALDIVDGYAARRLGLTSSTGAFVDIFADRIVEMVLWLYCTSLADLGIFPLILVSRICCVDAARLYVATTGREQVSGVWLTGWKKKLVASPLSKASYNLVKLFVFTVVVVSPEYSLLSPVALTVVLIFLTALSLIRGIPILVQAISHFQAQSQSGTDTTGPSSSDVSGNAHLLLYRLQVAVDLAFVVLLIFSTIRQL